MKWFIISDIHGSMTWCKKALKMFEAENCDRILILGDVLYHGPRNDLPDGYEPKAVIDMLSRLKEKIVCVRGNCEAEVDQMVLPFPIMAEYCVIDVGQRLIYAAHGHKYNMQSPLPVCDKDIILSGHTHVPDCRQVNGVYYLNPGSVALPKQNSPHSYMLYENGIFLWKDMEGKTFNTLKLK